MAGYTGIQEYNLRTLGAYHMIGNDDYEPQRTNNFELRVYGLNNLYTVDTRAKVTQNVAEESLTLSTVSVGQINTNVGVIEVPYGNTKVKFAGLPDISTSDVVFNDYIGKSTERILAAWHGLVFDPKNETIGRATNYKKRALLVETAPDGTRARVWELQGVWISNLQYGGYDYNGGATRQITATFTYDIAIPRD